MFVLPGLLALLVFIYARPFDFVPALRGIPFLYLFFGLAVFGYVVDLRLGKSDLKPVPHLAWTLAFAGWCFFTGALKGAASLPNAGLKLVIAISIYFLIAHGIRTFKAFEAMAATILVCTIFVGGVCVHLGMQPFECVAISPGEDHTSPGRPDGRPCETPDKCYEDPPDPEAMYRCEHAGLMGVTSIGKGRVRYVGVLHDPNEVAMAVSIGVPLALAFFIRRRTPIRLAAVGAALFVSALTVVYSQSRGGMLVLLSTLGVYFVQKYRIKGLIVGAVCALPMLMLGGRSGAEADASSLERVENLHVGLELFKQWPVLGAGFAQFTQHHHLTAHNSYVLAPAELGLFGLISWGAVYYLAWKIPAVALFTIKEPAGEPARVWATALLSSLMGMSIGIFFLSFNYHYVLWIYMGITGAFYAAVKRHKPDFRVRFGMWDLALVAAGGLGILAFIFVYTKVKLG